MSARCFTLSLAALAMLFCASARGALLVSHDDPGAEWFRVSIDYWNPLGSDPVVHWRAHDAAYTLGDPSQPSHDMIPHRVGTDFDRSWFWLRYDQPTVYLEALSGPQIGVALHDLSAEAAELPSHVTIVPDDNSGGFWYQLTNSSRHVTLDVQPIPEPTTALLCLCGLFAVRMRHSSSSGT